MSVKNKKIRYCSECGTIGGSQNCCTSPTPSFVSHDIAVQAHAGFRAAVGLHEARQAIADANTVGLKVVDTE